MTQSFILQMQSLARLISACEIDSSVLATNSGDNDPFALDLTGNPFDDDGSPFSEDGFPDDPSGTFLATPSFISIPQGYPDEDGDPYGDPYGAPKFKKFLRNVGRAVTAPATMPFDIARRGIKHIRIGGGTANPNSANFNPKMGSGLVNSPRQQMTHAAARAVEMERVINRQQGLALADDKFLLFELRGGRLIAMNQPLPTYDAFPNLANYSARSVRPIFDFIKGTDPYSEESIIAAPVGADFNATFTPAVGLTRLFAQTEFSIGQSYYNFVPETVLNIDYTLYNKESTTPVRTRLIVVQTEPRLTIKSWAWKTSKGQALPIVGEITNAKPYTVSVLAPAGLSTYTGNLLIPGPLNPSFIELDKMISKV